MAGYNLLMSDTILQLGVSADTNSNPIPSFLLQHAMGRHYRGDSFPVYGMSCKVGVSDNWPTDIIHRILALLCYICETQSCFPLR